MSGNVILPTPPPDSAVREFVLKESTLIVCEGKADQQFLQNLIASRKLSGFQVEFARPTPSDTGGGGQSKFRSFLEALEIPLAQSNPLANIILVSDNDTQPATSFESIQKQINESGLFYAPTRPLRRAKRHKKIPISLYVVMIPWTKEKGTLEHIILDALYDYYPDAKRCAESFY